MKIGTIAIRALLVTSGLIAGMSVNPVIASEANALNSTPDDELAACGPTGCAQIIFDVGNGTVTYVPKDPGASSAPDASVEPSAEPSAEPSPEASAAPGPSAAPSADPCAIED